MFLSGLFCCWGTSVHAVIELLFPHTIVWCSGKNTEGSIAAEEERTPKVNIQGSSGVHPGSGCFLDRGRPEWNQEEALTSQRGWWLEPEAGGLSVYIRLFLIAPGALGEGKAGSSWNLIEFIHPHVQKPGNPNVPRAFSFLKEDTYL